MSAARRLARELTKLHEHLPPGISVALAEGFQEWRMNIKVLDDNPIYAGETYQLLFRFGNSYPIEPPEVVFKQTPEHPIPLHPHVYSNGIICLDLLDRQGWSPVHNVESICVSLQSMLTGNTKRERPPGDEQFVRSNRSRPRDINFLFHDNDV
ncbi:ubiquitin-conjugating enzyme [Pseudovirgaria hyperparasitica]|uniref:Ubiquitin-conjugating enzyme E2 2 n=1 Tax=Pseudovirgaria hyperparasitica TaxID=470096 RepID=A0A6A6VZT9_9PEZI|nr:ubiquitin-conjugating enzyme [Pseudovirgaria hyperparasitica]KAF2754331.1 ubiquitin-conjugating enzyme [Pseudovirgaria hyperparasitica]